MTLHSCDVDVNTTREVLGCHNMFSLGSEIVDN